VPTRELALQVTREFGAIGKYRKSHEVAIYGGVPYGPQERALARGTQIVVGTPGRLLDHIEKGNLDLSGLFIVVLDEADRLLDMGFAPEVRRLLRRAPQRRQTALFSATLVADVRDLAQRFSTMRPRSRSSRRSRTSTASIRSTVEVLEQDKVRALEELLRRYEPIRCSCSATTKRGVDELEDKLRKKKHNVAAIHGDMDPKGARAHP